MIGTRRPELQLKLRWIVPLLLATTTAALFSVIRLWSSEPWVAWLGAFVASAALPFYFAGFLAIGGVARTSRRLPTLQVITMAGVALAAYGGFNQRGAEPPFAFVPIALALFGLAVLEWYVFIYSRYDRTKSAAIVIGKALPAVVLQALDGQRVTSRDFAGSKTLLVFFRGNWCPLCMAQLRELTRRADRLAAASVRVKLISNQSVERSRELASQLNLPSHFDVLHDRGLRAARALSIEDIGGTPPGMRDYPADTVMATVVALDAEGRVIFGDETDNYRVRPHPDSFIPLFEDRATSEPRPMAIELARSTSSS